jgi:hypothetical protein
MGAALSVTLKAKSSHSSQSHQGTHTHPHPSFDMSSFSTLLPSYYTPEPLTLRDLELCSAVWIELIDDTLPSPASPATPSSPTDETLPRWMYCKLYNDLSQDNELHKFYNLHIFLQSFLQLIPISLHQFETPKHFQNHFQYFANRCCQVGLTINHLNKFGSSFLEVTQEVDSDFLVTVAWKRLFSSILKIVLPFLVRKPKDLTLCLDSQLIDPSASTAVQLSSCAQVANAHLAVDAPVDEDSVLSSLTMNPYSCPFFHIPNSKANLPSHRFYTALENIIL